MANESITENLFRSMLKEKGYCDDATTIIVEQQKSAIPQINKLLNNASKKGMGKGRPDFIISFTNKPEDIIVVECKADVSKHESKTKDNYADYAVDGVCGLRGRWGVTLCQLLKKGI